MCERPRAQWTGRHLAAVVGLFAAQTRGGWVPAFAGMTFFLRADRASRSVFLQVCERDSFGCRRAGTRRRISSSLSFPRKQEPSVRASASTMDRAAPAVVEDSFAAQTRGGWVPAFAGMTVGVEDFRDPSWQPVATVREADAGVLPGIPGRPLPSAQRPDLSPPSTPMWQFVFGLRHGTGCQIPRRYGHSLRDGPGPAYLFIHKGCGPPVEARRHV